MLPSRSVLSREAQVLILTAGGPANEAPLRRLLDSEVNWQRLVRLTEQETATPIVWRWLQRVAADQLPPDVQTAWRKLAMVSEFRSLRLERLLHEAVGALAAHGIDVMLLKGSALAYTTYRSFADRPMGDVDLLVRPERAREAWSLLQTRGWTWLSARWPAHLYVAHHHLPPVLDAKGEGFRLELHTDLFPTGHPFQLSAEALWTGASTIRLDGRTVLVPDPLLQMLHLCIHFSWSHMMRWGGWRTFRDVETLARCGGVNWAELMRLARDSRATTACFWALRLARNLVGAQVPNDVLRALRPRLPQFLLDRLEHHYVLQLFENENGCPSPTLAQRLWELGIAPHRSNHGLARPWQDLKKWVDWEHDASPPVTWPRRVLSQARHIGASVSYLSRIAASARPAAP